MKKLMVALVCTLGVVACGEKQQAATPSSMQTTTTSAEVSSLPPTSATSVPEAPRTPSPSSTMSPMSPASPMDGSRDLNAPPDPIVGAPPANPNMDASGSTGGTGAAPATADQGGGGDTDITAAIRRAVVDDKTLSAGAKNVKVITVSGKVTLRGQVKSDEEKASIEAMAKSTAGVSGVDNQLQVKK
jgi:hypothetical protein